jgi:hypothetical protein
MTYEKIIKEIGRCVNAQDLKQLLTCYPIVKSPVIIPELSNLYLHVEDLLNAKEYILGIKGNEVMRLHKESNPRWFDEIIILKTKEEYEDTPNVSLQKGDIVQGFAFIGGTSEIDYNAWMNKYIGVKGTVAYVENFFFIIKFPQGKTYRYPTILAHKAIIQKDTIINTKIRELKVYLKNTQELVIFHLPIAPGEMMQERITESKLKVQICKHTSGNYTIYAKGYDMLTILKDMSIPVELSLKPVKVEETTSSETVQEIETENNIQPQPTELLICLPMTSEYIRVDIPLTGGFASDSVYLERVTQQEVPVRINHYRDGSYKIVAEGYQDQVIPVGIDIPREIVLTPSPTVVTGNKRHVDENPVNPEIATKKPVVESDLYNMELHETLTVNKYVYVLRVHGGWIYYYKNTSSTFVPNHLKKKFK